MGVVSNKLNYYYLLVNPQLITSGFKGSTIEHVSKAHVLDIMISVPSPEQQDTAAAAGRVLKQLCELGIIPSMPKKVSLYTQQREETLNKMLEILGITEENRIFSLQELDTNNDMQWALIFLALDVRKYFIHSHWTCFVNPNGTKRYLLSMIRYVLADMGYELQSIKKYTSKNKVRNTLTFYEVTKINR